MKAIILAAGTGSRLRPLTEKLPKSMVRVNGKQILAHQIDAYLNAGLKKESIYIAVGYKSEFIVDFISQNYKGVNVVVNQEYSTTNNMYSLYLSLEEIGFDNKNGLFISNGDCVYSVPVIKKLMDDPRPNLIAAEKGVHNEESMKITLQNGKINDISKQITDQVAYGVSIDLYKLGSQAVRNLTKIIEDYIFNQKQRNLWTEVALKNLLGKEDFEPMDIRGEKWVEIDNMDDLTLADRLFSDFNLKSKRCFIFDLDGTVYLGTEPITGTINFIRDHMRDGKDIYFMTNNTSKLPADYVKRLKNFDLEIEQNMVISPVFPLIEHLKNNELKNIFLVANSGFSSYLKAAIPGIKLTDESSDCQAIVLAYDTELTYEKLRAASILLQNNKNLIYLATHSDMVCPTESGNIPDIGTMITTIELTTGKKPDLIFGKPNPELLQHLGAKYKSDEMVLVGDRLYTDKKLADNIGCDFVCVLSGETRREDVEDLRDEKFPALIVKHLGEIID
ncbi:MAG: HAD-IIA family hydrolase [Calditrichaceae bacterium]